MDILATIFIGFIIGLVARLLKPGPDSMGFIFTTAVGILGSVLAGYIGQGLGLYAVGEAAGFLASVLGAIVVLAIAQAMLGRRSHRRPF